MAIYELPNLMLSAFAELTADTSTSSSSFVDLLTVNVVVSAGGILLCKFASSSTNATAINLFRLTVDGVVYQSTAIRIGAGVTILCPAAMVARIPNLADGSHVVKVQWAVTGATGYIRPVSQVGYEFASLFAVEMLDLQMKPVARGLTKLGFVQLSADATVNSTNMTDLLGLNLCTSGGDVLVIFSANSSNSNSNRTNNFQIVVDDSVRQSAGALYSGTPAVDIQLQDNLVLVAGSHEIKVQWATSASTARIRPVAAAGSECAQLLVMETTN